MKLPEFTQPSAKRNRETYHSYELDKEQLTLMGLQEEGSLKLQSGGCSSGENLFNTAFIYAFGSIVPMFPSQSVEQEFYQIAVTDPADVSQPLVSIAYKYLRKTENFYLARDLQWVFQIKGYEHIYMLQPSNDRSLAELIGAISNIHGEKEQIYHVVIGTKTGKYEMDTSQLQGGRDLSEEQSDYNTPAIVTPDGVLPAIQYSKIYTLTDATLYQHIEQAVGASVPKGNAYNPQVYRIVQNLLQLTRNRGDDDTSRAINFLVTRYLTLHINLYHLRVPGDGTPSYRLLSVQKGQTFVSGKQKTIELIFSLQSDGAAVEMYSIIVDISTGFPFVVEDWSPYVNY